MVTRKTVYDTRIAEAFWPGGTLFENMRRVGNANKANAILKAPKRTGHMASTIGLSVTPSGKYHARYTVSVGTDYAKFVIGGTTGPIRPKNGKYLLMRTAPHSRLLWNQKRKDGRWPFKSVAGQKANDFLEDALQQTLYEQGII
jgi:hypothetical protein